MVAIRNAFVGLMTIAAVWAADNSIVTPGWGQVANADDSLKITWNPTTSGNVNIILRQGGSQSLTVLYTIASNVANTGSYTWSIPAKQGSNTDYSIEIAPADNTGDSNFSPYFTILAVGQGITSSSSTGTVSVTSVSSGSHSDSSTTASASNTESTDSSATATATSGSETSSSASKTDESSSSKTSGSSLSTKASSSASSTESKSSSSASATTSAATSASTGAAASVQPASAAIALGAALGAFVLGTL